MRKVILIILILGMYSCSEMNDLHQPYLDRGETVYTERVQLLGTRSGNKRIELLWLLSSDISVKKARIVWKDRFDVKDSVDVDITVASTDLDLLDVISSPDFALYPNQYSKIIENLEEGPFLLEIRTLDSFGNMSVPTTITARAFGDVYLAGLTNRQIASHNVIVDEDVTFVMSTNLPEDYVYSEFKYTDRNGNEATYTLTEDTLEVFTLNYFDIDTTKSIFFRSVYNPSGTSIDLFYTDYQEYILN